MTYLFEHFLKTYPESREESRNSAIQAAEEQDTTCSSNGPAVPTDLKDEFLIPEDAIVVRPLSASVTQAAAAAAQIDLSDNGGSPPLSAIVEGLNRLVATSEVISHLEMNSKAILGLKSEIAMKAGYDIDLGHISTLDYIQQQAPCIPTPDTWNSSKTGRWGFLYIDVTNSRQTTGFCMEVLGQKTKGFNQRSAGYHL